jgi:hypothetical protein
MSEYSTAYQVACAPGPKATAAMLRMADSLPVLVVYLDPVNMTIQSPPSRAGAPELARFCRDLAREAARFAATIDPAGEPGTGPRHALEAR